MKIFKSHAHAYARAQESAASVVLLRQVSLHHEDTHVFASLHDKKVDPKKPSHAITSIQHRKLSIKKLLVPAHQPLTWKIMMVQGGN